MLTVTNLSYYYNNIARVNNVHFSIDDGQILGVFGHNGSGKSTMLGMLQGLLPVYQGSIIINHKNALDNSGYINKDIRCNMGVLLQGKSSDDKLSLWHNLYYFAYLMNIHNKEESIEKLLNISNLKDRAKEPIKNLSVGMCRRLELYRSFLHEPKIVILDEPTQGLDIAEAKKFSSFLVDYKNSFKASIILASHNVAEMMICDHIIMLKDGQIIKEGNPLALIKNLDFMRCHIVIDQPIGQNNLPLYDIILSNDNQDIKGKINTAFLSDLLNSPILLSSHLKSFSLEHPSLADVYEYFLKEAQHV